MIVSHPHTHEQLKSWRAGNTRQTLALMLIAVGGLSSAQTFVRINQVGFLPSDLKSAVVMSMTEVSGSDCMVVEKGTGKMVLKATLQRTSESYGQFPHVYSVDVTPVRSEGKYVLRVNDRDSAEFSVGVNSYKQYLFHPFAYLREQHCGYNPVFDTVCHTSDGIVVAGPGEGTRVDAVGGYHDASDYLRFLITTSYTSGILLMTYKEYPGLWEDRVDGRGRNGSNGVPDILDEARWGVEWMLKLTPQPGALYHQVADDRDHRFFDLPFRDSSDYGWGAGNGRPVYPVTGAPQGLFEHKNTSTGVSNVAGRTAAVFALASWLWSRDGFDKAFAGILRSKAVELYRMAVEREGSSESVPCRAPYRFHEITYHDDLEWGAAELYRLTSDRRYLTEALRWASLAADTSWMGKDTARHYEYFPYVNVGHYELFEFAPEAIKDSLREYYRRGLERAWKASATNAFGYGVPLIWVSNNLDLGLITQGILYKKMGGGKQYDALTVNARDWIFGRNPWGQSFVVGVPDIGSTPQDIHSAVTRLLGMKLQGAVVDGPVFASIFASLKGLHLSKPDQFAAFQSTWGVYHDDWGDYSTNEPTIDASAALVFVLAAFSGTQ